MPSLLHEALLALIRENPLFSAELLRLLDVSLPTFTEARLAEAVLNDLRPAEYHADAVVLFVDDRPVFGVIFEAQLRADARKRFTWPVYTVNARARHQCPFVLVVITTDEVTARWAAEPIHLGANQWWSPYVIGPSGVPIITDPVRARKSPELSVLSAMAHGKDDEATAIGVALAAKAALHFLTEQQQMTYLTFIETALSDAARKALEMHPETERLVKRLQRELSQREFAEGRAEGRAEGIVEGRAEGIAAAVLTVLDARGLVVNDAQRERITACRDLEQLDRWHRRAVTAADVASIFE